jgi:hypothetical protein
MGRTADITVSRSVDGFLRVNVPVYASAGKRNTQQHQ